MASIDTWQVAIDYCKANAPLTKDLTSDDVGSTAAFLLSDMSVAVTGITMCAPPTPRPLVHTCCTHLLHTPGPLTHRARSHTGCPYLLQPGPQLTTATQAS